MSAARGAGTLSIIRMEPAPVDQELMASGGEEGSRSHGWWKDPRGRGGVAVAFETVGEVFAELQAVPQLSGCL